jgi:hypothetical protein
VRDRLVFLVSGDADGDERLERHHVKVEVAPGKAEIDGQNRARGEAVLDELDAVKVEILAVTVRVPLHDDERRIVATASKARILFIELG